MEAETDISCHQQKYFKIGGQHYAQNQEEKPSIAKIVTDTISILRHSNLHSWNKIKTIMKEMQFQFHMYPIVYFHHLNFLVLDLSVGKC